VLLPLDADRCVNILASLRPGGYLSSLIGYRSSVIGDPSSVISLVKTLRVKSMKTLSARKSPKALLLFFMKNHELGMQ
jgi:hypothetical protein